MFNLSRLLFAVALLAGSICTSARAADDGGYEQRAIDAIASLITAKQELCGAATLQENEASMCNSAYDVVIAESQYRLSAVRLLKLRGGKNQPDDQFLLNMSSSYNSQNKTWELTDEAFKKETATLLAKIQLLDDRFAKRKQAER